MRRRLVCRVGWQGGSAPLLWLTHHPSSTLSLVSCSVQYATGEYETLPLDEVINDGHCSLLA